MNTQSNAIPNSPPGSRAIAPAPVSETRPMYWSVRRELWENRSIYLAPLATASLFLFGFVINMFALRRQIGTSPLDLAQQHELFAARYELSAALIMGTALIVGVFYSLDALYGERRDRSILFWKSLPVSDLTTVLAKLTIPLVILPLVTFAITIVTQWIMLLISSVLMLARGQSVAPLWSHLPLFQMSLMLLFHVVAIHGLQFAPVYSWMLLVSSWARRAPLLWAVLPPLAIGVAEKIAFNTSHFAALLGYLLGGGPEVVTGKMQMLPLTPRAVGEFFINPGLWIGLAVSVAFLAAAVRLRRYREPI